MSWAPVNESKVGTNRQNFVGTGNVAENQQISFTKEEPGTTDGVYSCLQRADGKPAVRHQRDLRDLGSKEQRRVRSMFSGVSCDIR